MKIAIIIIRLIGWISLVQKILCSVKSDEKTNLTDILLVLIALWRKEGSGEPLQMRMCLRYSHSQRYEYI